MNKSKRNIIVSEFITLDGVIEAPGGTETNHPHAGWHFRSPEAGKYKVDELAKADALLLGRNTFEAFAAYWPNETGAAFADPINKMPKYVVSSTLQKVDWNSSHILRDVVTDVAALKNSDGGDILIYGSGTLVRSLLHHDLVDELHLFMYPVVIGGGIRIFDDNRELKKFELKSARPADGNIVILEYVPASAK